MCLHTKAPSHHKICENEHIHINLIKMFMSGCCLSFRFDLGAAQLVDAMLSAAIYHVQVFDSGLCLQMQTHAARM